MDAGFGRIERWNEARGFGFLTPEHPQPGLPQRVFFHARDYDRRGARPIAGVRVRFMPQRQPDGRWGAIRVAAVADAARRHAARDGRTRSTAPPGSAIGPTGLWIATVGWLSLLGIASSAGRMSAGALVAFAGLNLLTFVAYAVDKQAAQRGRRRTPEIHLHLLELLGGWPAAGCAQQLLRHKRSKASYRRSYLAMSALHLLALTLWTFA
ncbi:DUF1294 domain-containing protein [Luteimonas deserti]|uniref:DUF1294 domain-containing protein n=1 Tax=Luteimonas deserti TaxID=2752306 RepID=A0A7Z0TV95_9GAMM|nr:DUF1294 domain-containing protein [Luteimonas deserti]NYZ63636.1 DUF1294 domain-containing protein [Luteimonas deserti]